MTGHISKHFGIELEGSVTVASQGQVVIPAKLRKRLDIKPGDSLLVFSKHGNIIGMIREKDAGRMIDMYESHMHAHQTQIKKIKSLVKKR